MRVWSIQLTTTNSPDDDEHHLTTTNAPDDDEHSPDDDEHDQEGLALTGGDWFNTIKNTVKNNKEAEKELAARMKKAKVSQTSLENEVFEGEPSQPKFCRCEPQVAAKKSHPPDAATPPPPPASSLDPPLTLQKCQKNPVPGRG
jgi:hypothetical protein